MSLINDALIDLENRDIDSMPVGINTNITTKKYSINIPLIILAIITLFVTIMLIFTNLSSREKKISTNNFVALSIPEQTDSPRSTPTNELIEKVSSTAVEQHLEVLSKAKQAFRDDRLMVPNGNNAYDLYLSVLDSDPQNEQALSGIERIKIRYSVLIDKLIKEKKFTNAQLLLNRFKKVATTDEVLSLQARIGKVEDSKTIKAMEAPENKKILVERSLDSVIRERISIARRYQAQGRAEQAVQLLKENLHDDPYSVGTAESLFDLYLGLNDTFSAGKFIQELIEGHPSKHYLNARLFYELGDYQRAIQELQIKDVSSDYYERTLALKAAAFQSQERFNEAETLYRKLVEVDQSNSRYWLGLAVSSEKNNLLNDSYQAYVISLRLGLQSDELKKYVASRIEYLSPLVRKPEVAEVAGDR